MKKKRINLKAKERQVERLAEAESNVRTRLVEMRIDLDALMHVLDRLTCVCAPAAASYPVLITSCDFRGCADAINPKPFNRPTSPIPRRSAGGDDGARESAAGQN
jgi:hypothetical protein